MVRDWARWNYSGYERKAAYPEYHGLIEMMEGVADDPDLGCGRAMWEYENDRLDTYGTPMAPMLLPFWTDGCIGSMEGLYFEASATTPYHFLNQRALSANCSCAQRDLPYGTGFDIDLGVQQLQLMGVRYYLAFTDAAVAAAGDAPRPHRDRRPTTSWHVYLVADSDLVVPLGERARRAHRHRAGHVVGRGRPRSGSRTRPAGASTSPRTGPTSGPAGRGRHDARGPRARRPLEPGRPT